MVQTRDSFEWPTAHTANAAHLDAYQVSLLDHRAHPAETEALLAILDPPLSSASKSGEHPATLHARSCAKAKLHAHRVSETSEMPSQSFAAVQAQAQTNPNPNSPDSSAYNSDGLFLTQCSSMYRQVHVSYTCRSAGGCRRFCPSCMCASTSHSYHMHLVILGLTDDPCSAWSSRLCNGMDGLLECRLFTQDQRNECIDRRALRGRLAELPSFR
jgi:hypothetical protein